MWHRMVYELLRRLSEQTCLVFQRANKINQTFMVKTSVSVHMTHFPPFSHEQYARETKKFTRNENIVALSEQKYNQMTILGNVLEIY